MERSRLKSIIIILSVFVCGEVFSYDWKGRMEIFSYDLANRYENEYFYVLEEYYETFKYRDRNYLTSVMPNFVNTGFWETAFDRYFEWYEIIRIEALGIGIDKNEELLVFTGSYFVIENVEEMTSELLKIETKIPDYSRQFLKVGVLDWNFISDTSDECIFYLEFDGDYINVYANDIDKKFCTFCKMYEEDIALLRECIKTNVWNDITVTWPRHADGTCDYDGNAAATSENANKEKLADALITATENNNAAEVRRLIAAGADVNAKDTSYGYRMTALMYAAVNNAADVAKLLIDAGADIEAKGRYSMTVLMWAAADNNLVDMAKLLLASGADMNAKDDGGMTALMHAAVYNAVDMAKLLIDAGADIEAKNNYGGTALMYAAEYDSADVAALLRAAGREPANVPDTERAESVEESAISKPAPAVGKTATVTENLRLRTDDKTTAEVVVTLAAGTRVKVEATGRGDAIDGIASNWVRVSVLGGAIDRDGNAVAAGTEGWLFGGYLFEAEDAESGSPGGEADAAKASALPIVLVVVGVAVLAILLAVVLLAVRRRKGSKE